MLSFKKMLKDHKFSIYVLNISYMAAFIATIFYFLSSTGKPSGVGVVLFFCIFLSFPFGLIALPLSILTVSLMGSLFESIEVYFPAEPVGFFLMVVFSLFFWFYNFFKNGNRFRFSRVSFYANYSRSLFFLFYILVLMCGID